jgi:hypothetical protein
MTTPAGWYPDPANASLQRWWSGASWTEHTAIAPSVAPAPTYAPAYATAPAEAGTASGASPLGFVQPYNSGVANRPDYGYAGSDFPDPRTMKRGAREKQLRHVNPVAYAGILVALLGMILTFWGLAEIAAIILSSIGFARAGKLRGQGHLITGRGYSVAGLVVGIVAFLVQMLIIGVSIVNSPGFQAGFRGGLNGQ